MPKRSNRRRIPLGRLLGGLFAQPPAQLYAKTSIYQCGREMEIENFKALHAYEPGLLCVDLGQGLLTITGDELQIVALKKGRLWLRGIFFKTEFSYK